MADDKKAIRQHSLFFSLLLLLFLIYSFNAFAGEPVRIWNTFMGSVDSDTTRGGIAVDASGNVYITGSSYATWGTPLNPHAGMDDIFVAKYNSSGVLQWHTFMGSAFNEESRGIALDDAGNVYITGDSGVTWGTPVNPYIGASDAFVAKLDSNGALQWNTFLGGVDQDYGYGIAVDGSGNVYVTGHSWETWGTPVNPHTVPENQDAFLARLDTNGVLQWHTFVGSIDDEDCYRVAVSGSGNVYVIGEGRATWGTPVNTYAGGYDAFVAMFNNTGVMQWNTFLGSSGTDGGWGIALDGSGNAYVVGNSSDTWGTPVNAHAGGSSHDAFVTKLNNSGTMLWNTFMGSNGSSDVAYAVALDSSGDLYVSGNSLAEWGTPVVGFAGFNDAFLAILDNNGTLQWNTFMGSANEEVGYGVAVDDSGSVYVSGESYGAWGTPVNPHSGSGSDGFVAGFNTIDPPENTIWSYDTGVPYNRLVLPDINTDGYDELLLLEDGEQIRVISGADGTTELWSYRLSFDLSRYRRGLTVIDDLDGDNISDIIAVLGTSGNGYNENNGDDEVFAISGAITPLGPRLLWFGGESLNIGFGANGPITLSDTNADTNDDIFITTMTPVISPLRGDYGYLISGGNGAIMWNWTYNPASVPLSSECSIWDIYGRAATPDLDTDGLDDIVVSGAGGFYGIEAWKGGGAVATNIWRSLPGESIREPSVVGDLTGDGVPEIAAAKFNDADLKLYVLNGSTGVEVWNFPFGNTATAIQNLGDVNSSGFEDIVLGSAFINGYGGTDYKVYALEGDPNAVSRVIWSYDFIDESHYVKTIADVNSDGNKDVIITTPTNGRQIVLSGVDGAVLSQSAFTGGLGPVQLGEFNNSAGEDFLTNSGNVVYALPITVQGGGPQGAAFPTQSIITTNAQTAFSVYAADMDNDGDLDVLSASDDDNTVAWYENTDGAGTFGSANFVSNMAMGARAVFAADMDGDEDTDVISANWDDGRIVLYRREILGTFTEITVGTHINPVNVFAADLDGDEDMDILSASYGDHTTAWYENLDGTGDTWTEHTVSTETSGAWDVYAADLDNDGDLDVVSAANWGNYDNNSVNENGVAWYENRLDEASNDFRPQQVISAAADGARVVRAADMDNDGDLDVISASWFDGKVAWYENLGGTFGDPSTNQNLIAMANINTQAMHVDDLDNDGDVDVLYGSWQDGVEHKIIWMENSTGDGSTWIGHDISTQITGCQSLYTADLDGDRDLDVLSASQDDNKIAWYPNQADAGGDVDSDGDGVPDSQDGCPSDPDKTAPGQCGCGVTDADGDSDGIADCVDLYPDNTGNKPILVSPADDIIIAAGLDVTLVSSGFQTAGDVTHVQSFWQVWRSDNGEMILGIPTYDLTQTILTSDLFIEGLQYVWRVGYEDSDAQVAWSLEQSFKIGTSEADDTVDIISATDVADYKMVSFVQWPDDPRAEAVFGDDLGTDYDGNYRIGTYNANRGVYDEYGTGRLMVVPGRGYWFLARSGLDTVVDGVPVSLSTDVYTALDYNTDTQDGWNMVGPPNGADYLWGNVQVVVDDGQSLTVVGSVQSLADDNPYIDRRLWRWESGTYASDTPETDPSFVMAAYAGYWVKAKQAGVLLRFDPGVQIASLNASENLLARIWHKSSTWLSNLSIFSQEAIADSDTPPMPMGGLDSNTVDPVFQGCFVEAISIKH